MWDSKPKNAGVLAGCGSLIPSFEHASPTRLNSSFCEIMVADRLALLAVLMQRWFGLRSPDKRGSANGHRLSEMGNSMQPHEVERRHEVVQLVGGAKRTIGKGDRKIHA